MKKWFAMILISLMFMTCYGSSLAVVAVEAPEEILLRDVLFGGGAAL